MSSISKLLEYEVEESAKEAVKKIGKNTLLLKKIAAIMAAKKHGIPRVAEAYDVSRITLRRWIKHLRDGNPEKLIAPASRKRKNKLNDEQRKEI